MGVQRVLCMSVPPYGRRRLKGRMLANSAIENRMTGIGQEAEWGPNGRKIGIYKWIWVRATIYVNRYKCKVCAKCRENWKHEREKEQGTEENTPELGDSTETLVLLSMLLRRVLSLSDRTWCPYFIRFLFCALCVFSLVCCVKRRIVQRLWFYYR